MGRKKWANEGCVRMERDKGVWRRMGENDGRMEREKGVWNIKRVKEVKVEYVETRVRGNKMGEDIIVVEREIERWKIKRKER